MTLDSALQLAGLGLQAVLFALLIWRRVYRTLPVFFCYLVWCLCSDALAIVAVRWPPEVYLRFFLVNLTIDDLFLVAILIELGRAVLRHNRATAPGRFLLFFLFVLAGLLVFSLAKWVVAPRAPMLEQLYMILLQGFAILRVAVLLTLVWWSSLKGLRWPNYELQIASGLGFYAIVALAVVIVHTHSFGWAQDHRLDQIQVASYLGVLAYWVLYFSQKAPEGNISMHKRKIFCYY